MHKTTKKDFSEFKKEFLFQQKRFGLTEWEIFFALEDLNPVDRDAEIVVDFDGMCATVRMTSKIRDIDIPYFSAKFSAKHEALHLLTASLQHLARIRYLTPDSIDEEWEKLVHRLEKVL